MKLIASPRTIGVCGIGQIGLALALSCWRTALRVIVYARNPEKLKKARRELRRMDRWMAEELPECKPSYGQVEFTTDLRSLDHHAELVIEGIAEDLGAKVALWKALAGAAARGAVLCSSTSGLSISEMGKRSGFARQVLGTHFWNPPHLMPLVEVVPGAHTSEEALVIAENFCHRIGKQTVRVKVDAPGFIGNRMLHALWREAIDLVQRGIASAEDVDKVAKLTFGLRLPVVGPLENIDLVGLDLVHTIHQYLLADLAANRKPGRLLEQKAKAGDLGMKSGRGFYHWSKPDAAALIHVRDKQIVRSSRDWINHATTGPRTTAGANAERDNTCLNSTLENSLCE